MNDNSDNDDNDNDNNNETRRGQLEVTMDGLRAQGPETSTTHGTPDVSLPVAVFAVTLNPVASWSNEGQQSRTSSVIQRGEGQFSGGWFAGWLSWLVGGGWRVEGGCGRKWAPE